MENLKVFSREQLALRNGKEKPEIWIAYKGFIYDVTSSELFEGGKHFFHDTGCDLTDEMEDAPHLEDVMEGFPLVGKLGQPDKEEVETVKPQKKKVDYHLGEIVGVEDLSRTARKVTLKVKDFDQFNYVAGQFINIRVSEGKDTLTRSYSVCGIHPESGTIEILVGYRDLGRVSPRFFNEFKLGDQLKFKGPAGKFVAPENIDKPLCFITADIGISSIRPIIEAYLNEEIRGDKRATLIYRNPFYGQQYFHEAFKAWASSYKKFAYFPLLPGEVKIKESSFRKSIVDVVQEQFPGGQSPLFFICGFKDFVENTVNAITELGFDAGSVNKEIYN